MKLEKLKKKEINKSWCLLITIVIILYFIPSTKEYELRKITVELESDMINVKTRKTIIDHKFWTKEYGNQFNILKGSITSGKHEAILNLKKGEVIDLFIAKSDYQLLSEEKQDITVMGIISNGEALMLPDKFYHNRRLYKIRLTIFAVFTMLMLLLNGLIKVPERVNYIIIGTFMGIIIILRIFSIWIY